MKAHTLASGSVHPGGTCQPCSVPAAVVGQCCCPLPSLLDGALLLVPVVLAAGLCCALLTDAVACLTRCWPCLASVADTHPGLPGSGPCLVLAGCASHGWSAGFRALQRPSVTCFAFPSERLRGFGTWFFQRKWELLFTNCLLEANTEKLLPCPVTPGHPCPGSLPWGRY